MVDQWGLSVYNNQSHQREMDLQGMHDIPTQVPEGICHRGAAMTNRRPSQYRGRDQTPLNPGSHPPRAPGDASMRKCRRNLDTSVVGPTSELPFLHEMMSICASSAIAAIVRLFSVYSRCHIARPWWMILHGHFFLPPDHPSHGPVNPRHPPDPFNDVSAAAKSHAGLSADSHPTTHHGDNPGAEAECPSGVYGL